MLPLTGKCTGFMMEVAQITTNGTTAVVYKSQLSRILSVQATYAEDIGNTAYSIEATIGSDPSTVSITLNAGTATVKVNLLLIGLP